MFGEILHFVAQQAPATPTGWLYSTLSGLGGAGLATGLMWKVHAEDRKTMDQLIQRIFLLGDRGMAVSNVATEVVRDRRDPALDEVLEKLEVLLRAKR